MPSPSSEQQRKQVVIVGAGFGGCALAKYLDQHARGKIDITIISPREEFFLYKVAGLRLATTNAGDEQGWAQRVLIPLNKLFTAHPERGRFVQGTVVSVDHDNKQVQLAGEQSTSIRYDVLAICTGSRNFSPGEPPSSVVSRQETEAYYAAFRSAVQASRSIVVVGAGATGLELCGEIRQYYPDVEVHCVTRSAQVLAQGATSAVPASFARRVQNELAGLKIKLVLQDEVVSDKFDDLPWLRPTTAGGGMVTLKSGKTLKCDLLVSAVGFQYNTGFLPSAWLVGEGNNSQQVTVDAYGQVVAGAVFCLGDAANSGAAKLGYLASQNASSVGHNILRSLAGRRANSKLSVSGMGFVLPLGETHGRSLVMGLQVGGWITSLAKGRGLFSWRHWMAWGHRSADLPQLANQPGLVRHTLGLPFGMSAARHRRHLRQLRRREQEPKAALAS